MIKETKTSSHLAFALLAYMLFVAFVVTLLPFRFHWPDRFTIVWRHGLFDVVTNIFLFVPIGFLYQLGRRRSTDPWCLRALTLGLAASLFIEVAQIFLKGRTSSVVDLLANGSGAWTGAVFHDRIERRLNERLLGQLALELPLMNLVYLLVPLLWLNGLATGNEPSRLWLAPILGLFGGMILTAVWTHRLKPARVLSENTLALAVAVWFFLASLPGFAKRPIFLTVCGLGIAAAVRLQVDFVPSRRGGDRRFELPTLVRVWPLYAVYLFFLALWPLPWSPGPWTPSLGFADFGDIPGIAQTLRLLEYVTAFALLGYMVAESRGRNEETLLKTMKWVLFSCFTTGCALELARGFHPQHVASLMQLMIATGASLYGGIVYRLQLDAVQRLLARDRTPTV